MDMFALWSDILVGLSAGSQMDMFANERPSNLRVQRFDRTYPLVPWYPLNHTQETLVEARDSIGTRGEGHRHQNPKSSEVLGELSRQASQPRQVLVTKLRSRTGVHLRAPFLSHSEIFYSNTKWCSQRLLKIHLLFLTKRSKRQQEEWHAGSVVLNRSLTFSEFRFPLWQSVTSAPLFTPTLRVFVRTQWSSLEGIFHPIYGHPVDISQLNLCGCSLTTTARFVSNLRAWT